MQRLFVSNFCSCACLLYAEFNIITNPTYFYRKGEIQTNFDSVLRFDSTIDADIKTICDIWGIPLIGIRRYSKFEQAVILFKSNIMTPDTYDCRTEMGKGIEVIDCLLKDINEDTHLVLKPHFGAKGIGQVRIIKGDIYNKLYDLQKEDSDESKAVVSENDNNLREPGYMSQNLRGDTYCIQKFEKGIQQEYRVILFYGVDPIIIQRKIGTNSWQSNNGAKPDNSSVYITETLDNLFGKANKIKLYEFFYNLNTPFLSVDIYIDKDGNMGIMEFQMEFGYSNCPSNILLDRMSSSVLNMINGIEKS